MFLPSSRLLSRRMSTAIGPMQQSIRNKIETELSPTILEIRDDSSKHAGHAAMKGLAPNETHFAVSIVSDKFTGKPLVQRHKLVYTILDDELKNGLHALQLITKTPEEWQKMNK